ncbi:class I SAM-dependent methyltransferase [Mycobacterium sp. SMC-8]|uniref:class I SAM-dependent methyltransferase n=1 Tax=Mycobacterium sp. SMC-8 TaxID=2857060 RepID=UPI0021B304BD|nr:class I SAM-dependent methyltransferase [Mycobacterium sp. SMC-8]
MLKSREQAARPLELMAGEDETKVPANLGRLRRFVRSQVLQTEDEWVTRGAVLSQSLAGLVDEFSALGAAYGIEIGCQRGALTDQMGQLTRVPKWTGIDPTLPGELVTPRGCVLHPARASRLEFPDATFDVALFANVFEHIPPDERDPSLREIFRVLKPGGVVVGQIPNPHFLIESHSRLPLMGWLPTTLQHRYWKLSPVHWNHDFYVVTMKHIRQSAGRAGFDVAHVRNFNYPPEVIPQKVRWIARALERPMQYIPWAWQFILRRPT